MENKSKFQFEMVIEPAAVKKSIMRHKKTAPISGSGK